MIDAKSFNDVTIRNCIRTTLISISIASSIAIFIIGCLAITGVIGGSTSGWVVLGFGGGAAALACLAFGLKYNVKIVALVIFTSLYFIVIGSLGGVGILNAVQFGWAATIPIIVLIGCTCLSGSSASAIKSMDWRIDPPQKHGSLSRVYLAAQKSKKSDARNQSTANSTEWEANFATMLGDVSTSQT